MAWKALNPAPSLSESVTNQDRYRAARAGKKSGKEIWKDKIARRTGRTWKAVRPKLQRWRLNRISKPAEFAGMFANPTLT